jgi:hypothetical protein
LELVFLGQLNQCPVRRLVKDHLLRQRATVDSLEGSDPLGESAARHTDADRRSAVYNTFNICRHLITPSTHRILREHPLDDSRLAVVAIA